ncbi:hypothetical protein [Burkholderia oklahomensis]|uniref:hypothetical protein n=1 Tax=Burkholderia oklahomensis TaxID=342113 RepID=UPI00016A75AF|nr:hypothetical protein [Burkholderia oklahomensis]AJX34412.1 hypothetical protein BG90_6047 [Burkholderia oklahomensis C6786]SUY29031.1 Uncharacterised protein [Burkholderia oklahomensis]
MAIPRNKSTPSFLLFYCIISNFTPKRRPARRVRVVFDRRAAASVVFVGLLSIDYERDRRFRAMRRNGLRALVRPKKTHHVKIKTIVSN